MIKTQVREVTTNVSKLASHVPAPEPSHIHIPRPSRTTRPGVADGKDVEQALAELTLDEAA